MTLSLYLQTAYEEVLAVVARGLAWAAGAAEPARVTRSSISGLRSKIGAVQLRELVERCCVPMAEPQTHPGAFYAGLPLGIDVSCFELPDEEDNAAQFGCPGSRTGTAAYPQARCAVPVQCLTYPVLGANLWPNRRGECERGQSLLPRLRPDKLCLADRGFNGFEHWRQARATGAHLLWRCSLERQLPVEQLFDDGSYLSTIRPTRVGRAEAQAQGIVVRVIEYALPGLLDSEPRYRLMTRLLDPQAAPAQELAALYHQRWEIEAVFDELKTHLRQSRRVLRSKTPELVRQEFYGWVLAHYAVRWLHQGATRHRIPHEDLSFTGHVQLLRRAQPRSGAFPPRAAQTAKKMVLEVVGRQRHAACPAGGLVS